MVQPCQPLGKKSVIEGFNILEESALNEKFWDLCGFKECEIEFFLNKAFGNNLSCVIKEIMSWLKEKNDGYFFHHNQFKGIFNIHGLNFGGKAVELMKTNTRKIITIEFDNIKMENVKLDGCIIRKIRE
ncbi:hypothetical protein RhiirC2_868805 [Rhizophagus irregularis]|uniref:Uncharacterized protein n=1 Tax=Rhizophagus irregularis TaxID=588596 RepID=A0A2N1MUX3_9GLOM|nr:hypothetical protein RhiirC2_868805 [Rhizophagus irregularis]